MRVKGSYGVGLKSAQAWGCPCSIKCLLKDIRSALTLSLSLFCTCVYIKPFWKLADRYKCAQPIGDIFPTSPLPFVLGVHSWLWSWLWDTVSYSQLRHRVPYTMFFFEYSLRLMYSPLHSINFLKKIPTPSSPPPPQMIKLLKPNIGLFLWPERIREKYRQDVTKRCRLSWLTNGPLVYEPKCVGGGGGGAGPQPMCTAV